MISDATGGVAVGHELRKQSVGRGPDLLVAMGAALSARTVPHETRSACPFPGYAGMLATRPHPAPSSHLLNVRGDKPVCLAMACSDIWSHKRIRLIFLAISMAIPFFPYLKIRLSQ